jgi:hypothetical protein
MVVAPLYAVFCHMRAESKLSPRALRQENLCFGLGTETRLKGKRGVPKGKSGTPKGKRRAPKGKETGAERQEWGAERQRDGRRKARVGHRKARDECRKARDECRKARRGRHRKTQGGDKKAGRQYRLGLVRTKGSAHTHAWVCVCLFVSVLCLLELEGRKKE